MLLMTASFFSPEGTKDNSPGRKPWDSETIRSKAPAGATETPERLANYRVILRLRKNLRKKTRNRELVIRSQTRSHGEMKNNKYVFTCPDLPVVGINGHNNPFHKEEDSENQQILGMAGEKLVSV